MEMPHWIKRGAGMAMLYALLLIGCGHAASDTLPDSWVLADSSAAAQWIQRDSMTPFFQQISTLDMRLQMGQAAPPDTLQRDSVLEHYREFLTRQARSFQPREKQLLREVLTEAREMVSGLNPELLPPHLRLVKISGKAYGPSVYYTRENCIMIPQEELRADNHPTLRQVLLHELFHIYSRYHLQRRQALYRIIGFAAAQDSVLLPDRLRKRQLLNPDGVRWQQQIRLRVVGEDSSRVFFPFLYARERAPGAAQSVMDYLAFSFFRADSTQAGWVLQTTPTPLPQLSDFHQKTGGNTDYIIHPDEILADNFVLLVYRSAGMPVNVDEDGKRILDRLQQKLQ